MSEQPNADAIDAALAQMDADLAALGFDGEEAVEPEDEEGAQ